MMESIKDKIYNNVKSSVEDQNALLKISDRLSLEEEVRELRKEGLPCPHKKGDGNCYGLYFRCGSRQKYSDDETPVEIALPHKCNYDTEDENKYTLIVDDIDESRTDSIFLLTSSGADKDKITEVESVRGAINAVESGKLNNKPYCLTMTDLKMNILSGHYIINYLIERNHPSAIAIRTSTPNYPKPDYYLGDMNITPDHPVVSIIIDKVNFDLNEVQTVFRGIIGDCKKVLMPEPQ